MQDTGLLNLDSGKQSEKAGLLLFNQLKTIPFSIVQFPFSPLSLPPKIKPIGYQVFKRNLFILVRIDVALTTL